MTAPVLGDGSADFSPGVSERRGSVKTYFDHGLKNTDAQSSVSGAVSAVREYDAFGNVVSLSGAWVSQFGNAGRFGYQEDGDSGLKLLGHRYYDSGTGRFLTRDPAKDGRNWYGYCGNSPVGAVDPEGLMSLYRWIYTGDPNASDEVYQSALDQAWKTLTTWFKHFAIGNGLTAPPAAVAVGPYPKALVPRNVARVVVQDGASRYTSGVRVAAQRYPSLRPAARLVKGGNPLIWLYLEVVIAWSATYHTLHDPILDFDEAVY